MAQYTVTMKEIQESKIDIFNFEYPIFDEKHRATLEQNIINHYYFREIGTETIGRFIFRLKTKMQLIMPYYNELYMTQSLDQRILDNYDVKEDYSRTIDSVQDRTENSTGNSKELFSDTPQSRTTLGNEYLTNVTENSGGQNATGTSTGKDTETWSRTMKGNIGIQTDADAVMKYRDALINVDQMIIEELNELFMLVY